MSFFIVIGCSWLLVAVMMLLAHRRAENPETGQWRSEPSTLFGGPDHAPAASAPPPAPTNTSAAA
ncbi:MAG: hypothetical protein ABW179_02060 [Methylobacterium sp.]